MKKAVILLAHQLPNQLNEFVSQLISDGTTDVYLHINKKCESILDSIKKNEHLFITTNNIPIVWGTDSVLHAILVMFKEIIDSNAAYDYVLCCSGQDLLIQTGLDSFLEQNKGQVFIDTEDMAREYAQQYAKTRLLYKWPKLYLRKIDNRYNPIRILRSIRHRLCMKNLAIGKKRIENFNKINFYKDYYHFAVPYDVFSYIYNKSNDKEYMEIFNSSFLPEELFFTTTIMNSEFKNRVYFVDNKAASIALRNDETNHHPKIYESKDIDYLEHSGFYLARKFDERIDKEVINYFVNKIVESNAVN